MTRSFVARLGTAALMALAALMLAGCLGKSSSGSAQVRTINLATGSDTASVAIALSNGADAYNFPTAANAVTSNGTISGYLTVNATAYSVNVTPSGPNGTGTPVYDWASFGSGDIYTGVVWGTTATGLHFSPLGENDLASSISAGFGAVRILNATGTTGSINVYLTQDVGGAETALSSASPIASAVQGSTVSSFRVLPVGSYRLRVTDYTSGAVLLDATPVPIVSQQYLSIAVTSATTSGVLANASLIVEQGAYTQLVNSGAVPGRLRVAAGVQQAGAVTVSVDGTPFIDTGYTSPLAGPYANIAAGAHTITVSVNGTAVSTISQTIASGNDYTLLAWGPANGASAAINLDDNSLPLAGDYKIRVVNGSATAGSVALADNYLPITNSMLNLNSVAVGSFATPVNTSQDLNAQLSIKSLGNQTLAATWGSTLMPLQLPTGAIYTIFALDGNASPVATLVRDR